MKKSDSFTYDKNIVLDETRMGMLHTILLKFSTKLSFEARLVDDSSIKVDSFNELMEYSNFKKGRIKRLEIWGYAPPDSWDRNISITFSSEKHNVGAFVCNCCFSNENDEYVYKKEIQELLEKSTVGYVKSRIGDVIIYIFMLLSAIWVAKQLVPESTVTEFVVASLLAQIIFSLFNNFIWKKLFPMVSFSWGEAVSYYSSIAKWKDGVFWSIIIAIPVGIVASCIYKVLFP